MTHSKMFTRPAILAAGIASLLTLAAVTSAPAAVTYIGEAIIDGSGTDQSGLNGAILEDGISRNNALNGFGSGLVWAGGNTFYGLADRGPNKVVYNAAVDNTTSYPNRIQKFTITVTPAAGPTGFSVNVTPSGTTLLKNAVGVQYTGYSAGYQNNPNTRLDSEGFRVAPDGTFWVSDEYGPYILHFNQSGQQIGSLPLPVGWQPTSPQANAAAEAYPVSTVGRTTNRGLEGLAITPDGKTLVAMIQSSLIQDGGLLGSNCRILVYDLTNPSAAPKQFLYYLDGASTPISELLAANNHQFLVDERNSSSGAAGIKKLYMFD
jgi:hypothetical protein